MWLAIFAQELREYIAARQQLASLTVSQRYHRKHYKPKPLKVMTPEERKERKRQNSARFRERNRERLQAQGREFQKKKREERKKATPKSG